VLRYELWVEGSAYKRALDELGYEPAGDELAGLTPTIFEHLNALGTYDFSTDDRPDSDDRFANTECREKSSLEAHEDGRV
jgi:hypothetical protein